MAYNATDNSALAMPTGRGSSLPFITNVTQPGRPMFTYNSADALATVRGAGYFTNGTDLGMVLGSIVLVTVTEANPTLNYVSAIDATTGAATITASSYN